MRYMQIEGGVAVNAIEVTNPADLPQFTLVRSDTAHIGDLWDGEHFTTPDAVVEVPEVISPRQFRQALTHGGFRATVESAVSSADQDTKDWYEFATQFERHHTRVLAMAQALGYTDAQVDAVWTYGAGL